MWKTVKDSGQAEGLKEDQGSFGKVSKQGESDKNGSFNLFWKMMRGKMGKGEE